MWMGGVGLSGITLNCFSLELLSGGYLCLASPELVGITELELRQEYPLNLSILLSGGKETN